MTPKKKPTSHERRLVEVLAHVRRAPLAKRDQITIARDLRKHWHQYTAAEQKQIAAQWSTKATPHEEMHGLAQVEGLVAVDAKALTLARIAAVMRGERVDPIMVILEPSEGWWAVSMPSVPGAYTQGRTVASALRMLGSLLHYLEKLRRDGLLGNKAQDAALRQLGRQP